MCAGSAGLLLASLALPSWASLDDASPVAPATQPVSLPPAGSFDKAMIIPITGEITDVTQDSVERRIDRAREEHYPLVIIELDTPGGLLNATLEMCTAIKRLRDEGVKVYAWVNPDAYSAGTILALACDGIIMASHATMGDCQPIMFTGGGASAIPDDIEAKATSPLLAELRDSCRRSGYSLDLVLSLIRPELEIYWLENPDTGERRFVDRATRNRLFESKAAKDDADDDDDKRDEDEDKSKSDAHSVDYSSDADSRTAWRYVKEAPGLGAVRQPIVAGDTELLTMRTAEATAYGFSIGTVSNDDDLRSSFNVTGAIERTANTWWERTVAWLASPMVRGVLFLLMLLGAYTEFQVPGFGLPGTVALIALVLFLGAPYMAGFTVTWEIIAIVLGVALLLVEAFLIPGFGVAGISGIVLLCIGLLASFVPEEPGFSGWQPHLPRFEGTWEYLYTGLRALAGGLGGSVVGMILVARYLPKVPVAGRIIAANPTREQITVDDPYDGIAQVGDIGRSETLLRPAGKARFGATLVDVVSQGEYIPKGDRVEVIERGGSRVVVRRVD